MRFANPWALLMFLSVPLAAYLLFWLERQRRGSYAFSSLAAFDGLPRGLASRLEGLPRVAFLVSLTLLCLALARPQLASSEEEAEVEGIDIVVALDLSNSMQAADFKPKDRLFVAKQVVGNFVLSRKTDRIGLVVFGREAYTQCPLTLDYSMVHTILESLTLGVIDGRGTAIGNALGTAINRLRESEARSRTIILITDGESNAGNLSPQQAADLAKTLGIKVFPILVGKQDWVPVPDGVDLFGNTIYRQAKFPVNPELLQEIATTTGGHYTNATDRESLEQGLYEILETLEKSRIVELGAVMYAELFHWPLIPALILLFLGLFLEETWLRRFL